MDLYPYKPINAVLILSFFTELKISSLIEDFLPRKFLASQNSTSLGQNKYLFLYNKFSIIWNNRNKKLFNIQNYGLFKNHTYFFMYIAYYKVRYISELIRRNM